MEKTISVERHIDTDVLVAGGGVGGCAAALAAARNGAKTVLIESGGCLGGQAGFGIVTPFDAVKSTAGKSFGGMVEEFRNAIIEGGKKYCSCGSDDRTPGSIASPHIVKYILLKKLVEAGVDIRFHTTLTDATTDGRNVKSVTVFDKSGYCEINAASFIDATGDGDLIAASNAGYVLGSEPNVFKQLVDNNLNMRHFSDDNYSDYSHAGLMQPVSIFFVMGGVDVDRAVKFNNKKLRYEDLGTTKEEFEKWAFANTLGFEVSDEFIPMPQGRVLVTYGPHKGTAVINMSRVTGIDGSDAGSLNDGEIKAQLQLIAIIDFLKTFVPGFEHSYYMQSASALGVRESRRLKGRYTLTGNEAINALRNDDVVARGSYIIDIHDPNGKAMALGGAIKGEFYDIPYGCLLAREYDNLLACGRCISVDHVAHSSTRIQGTCVMTGQAAGTAAALAIKEKTAPAVYPVELLQKQLISDGVYID